MVWVLADDNDLEIFGVGELEGLEYEVAGRINGAMRVFVIQKSVEAFRIWLGLHMVEEIFPRSNHGYYLTILVVGFPLFESRIIPL